MHDATHGLPADGAYLSGVPCAPAADGCGPGPEARDVAAGGAITAPLAKL